MDKPKIRFIEPMGAPSNVFAKYMNIPLLGPVYLASIAKKEGYNVRILNENIIHRKVSPSELIDTDILCLSCITATVNRGKDIARQYKQLRKENNLDSHVIIGGIHSSMIPDDVKNDFDQIVCGEAESVIIKLINGSMKQKIIHCEPLDNLDMLPIPDFSLVKNFSSIKVWPVMTSRGCPHHCNFCSITKMFGKGYRTQSIERILEEITKYKSGWIFFVDDNFTALPSRSHRLLDEMIKINFSRPWTAQVRAETSNDIVLVRKMRKAGCHIVYIGLESINPNSLILMQKHQNLQDINNAISTFQKEGIHVHGMFMLGNDPDTNQIFSSTSHFCKQMRLNYVQYSILTPLPGTEVYESFEKSGRLIHKNWSLYDGLHAVFYPRQMSAFDLQCGMIKCFKSFYTYNNAVKDSFLASLSIFDKLKSQSSNFYHAYYPAFMKIVGKSILHNWIKNNSTYLQFLKSLEPNN